MPEDKSKLDLYNCRHVIETLLISFSDRINVCQHVSSFEYLAVWFVHIFLTFLSRIMTLVKTVGVNFYRVRQRVFTDVLF